jgi:hypothetical protein
MQRRREKFITSWKRRPEGPHAGKIACHTKEPKPAGRAWKTARQDWLPHYGISAHLNFLNTIQRQPGSGVQSLVSARPKVNPSYLVTYRDGQ